MGGECSPNAEYTPTVEQEEPSGSVIPGVERPKPKVPEKERGTDALGGDVMLNAFTSLSAPLPASLVAGPAGDGVGGRVFGFLNVGSLVSQYLGDVHTLKRDVSSGMRASVGMGVGVPMAGLGTLELTFSKTFWAQRHDERQWWQVGLRMESGGP